MELYILDDQLRRSEIVDVFESLIWSERRNESGDFELLIHSTVQSRSLFVRDTMLAMNRSKRVMVVETVEDSVSEDGIASLLVRGPSIEEWLKRRVAKEAPTPLTNISKGTATVTIATPGVVTKAAHNLMTGDAIFWATTGALPTGLLPGVIYYVIWVDANTFRLATTATNALAGTAINTTGSQSGVHTLWWSSNGKWRITDTPANTAREIFTQICVNGVLDTADIIPFMETGNLYPADGIAEEMDEFPFEIPIQSVYDAIKQFADLYDFGFRLYRNEDASQLFFNVYMGSDRTTQQSTLPPVVFSPGLDNLTEVTELSSVAKYKNVAYVFSPNGFEKAYAEGADENTSGFERRVLLVEATDITDAPGATLTALLKQRGLEELAKNRSLSAFDGRIPPNSRYKYEVDYYLGDLVEMRNVDGVTNNMRVSEQIFVQDAEGERDYPTLAVYLLITPGSWLAWNYNITWDEAEFEWEDAV